MFCSIIYHNGNGIFQKSPDFFVWTSTIYAIFSVNRYIVPYLKDFEAAYYLQKKASDIQNDNVQAVLRQSAVKAQKKFLEKTKKEMERTSRRRQTVAGCFSVLLIVTMSLFFLYIKYRKDQVVQEKDLLLDTYLDLTRHHSALNIQYLDLSAQTERLEKGYVVK